MGRGWVPAVAGFFIAGQGAPPPGGPASAAVAEEIQAIIDGCATWDDAAGEWAGNLRDRLLFSLLA
ncbi:MAG TPA: hypothetical protein VGS06_05875 [Streptosporangiaceae bacterium]|nr:hypothetical protein [Streptosporangiaceae bacterium]